MKINAFYNDFGVRVTSALIGSNCDIGFVLPAKKQTLWRKHELRRAVSK